MSAYTDYITALQRLLHDSNDQFWSAQEKLDYTNEARNRVVRDTGCYRVLQSGYIMPNNEVYAFGGVTGFGLTAGGSGYVAGTYALGITGGGGTGATGTYTVSGGAVTSLALTAQGSGYTSAPAISFPFGGGSNAAATAGILLSNTFDVINLTVHWGNSRLVLAQLPWSEFNAKARYFINYSGRPTVMSSYANNSVYIQPIPDQTYAVEWDSSLQPPVIVDTTTVEVIPFPFRSPVPFYAAYLAKLKEQSWGEAKAFKDQYTQQIMDAIRSSFTRRSRNPYA